MMMAYDRYADMEVLDMTGMTDKVKNAIANMLIGSLRYYASECMCCEDEVEEGVMMNAIADHIEDGTATEEEWLEAIAQMDMSD